MSKITLTLIDKRGATKKSRTAENHVYLDYSGPLEQGDCLKVSLDKAGQYLVVQADEALNPSLIYLKGKEWTYTYPLDQNLKLAYPQNAFIGDRKYMDVRLANIFEIKSYRNLALNVHDQKKETGAYPHAWANVETRNDATFFARNAIDGVIANESHGSYPYQSWGINRQKDAFIEIDFGRTVTVDLLVLILRGDFPHDSYWTETTVQFSDGSQEQLHLKKTRECQQFPISPRTIEWVKLKNLRKADDESPFPALTEFEIYGKPLE